MDIHQEYLCDPSNDATVLPYFEGDYWVNEAEVIIKDLKEGKGPKEIVITDDNFSPTDNDNVKNAGNNNDDSQKSEVANNNKSKRKSKSKMRVVRTSSQGGNGGTNGNGKERDPVMVKLSNIIEPMKDTFFVARLHPKEYAEKHAMNR